MSNNLSIQPSNHASGLLGMNKPSMPNDRKQMLLEQRISDPSSSSTNEKRYPIPSFFEYRAKPKEYDFL